MAEQQIRLGVDVGGTFTDVALEVGGALFSTKVLTDYTAPEVAIVDAIANVCGDAGLKPQDVSVIIHGTTLATNALIERKGANTALITTKGFRDVIEMRTESRFEQYDLNLKLPEALIAREHRLVLDERIDARGEVLVALQRRDIEELAETIKARGYVSVAVGLIHSYLNDVHEKLVREVFEQKLPDVLVSLSSEVSPQMREYERFNTVAANAYVKPQMASYLSRLAERLKGIGAQCPVFLMHSGGGIISLESALQFPVRLVESGPAGGAIFAAHIAGRYEMNRVLSFDMGGTTAKICLIKDLTPKTSRVFEVARTYRFKKGSGMPISIPVIDMVEIGAGGGSIAHVDQIQQIRVGPHSAGSEPGPACYNRGGDKPTVTDADLALGRLDPDNFAGGSIVLSAAASGDALNNEIGKTLDMDGATSAFAVCEVVDENMANAARVHAVENGEDLSNYSMIAFGGAAPLHAGRLCEKLGIGKVLIPPGAGVGSAIGFLKAPFSFEATRSIYQRLSSFQPDVVRKLFEDLKQEATQFVRTCDPSSDIGYDYKAYVRYVGQGWEIPVDLSQADTLAPDTDQLLALFEKQYEILFGRTVEGLDVEVTSWSINAATPVAAAEPVSASSAGSKAIADGVRQLFDPARGDYIEAVVVERGNMASGHHVEGPAIITEDETTIIVPSGFKAIGQPDGCIELTRDQEHQS